MTFYYVWATDQMLGTVSAPNAETAMNRALLAYPDIDVSHVEER